MSRQIRMIEAAALVSKHTDQYCDFSIGAIVVIGNRVISAATCTRKTHPKNPKRGKTKRKQLCAETAALMRAVHYIGEKDFKHCTVYVARTRKNGSLAMSRPCEFCQEFMRRLGIKEVFYTTNEGTIEKLKLTSL